MSDPARAAARTAETSCRLCGSDRTRTLFEKRGYTFARCAECGLVSLAPVPTPGELAAHHEQSYTSGGYATFAAAEAIREEMARYRLGLVRPLAGPGPWLDLGCSTGSFVAAATAAGFDAEGLELSDAAVAQARARGLNVRQSAVEDFQPTRPYAVLTAFDVVEHLPDPARVVAHAATWLAPNGVLVLTVPNIASPTARLLGRHWFYYAPPDHVHYFTPTTIRRLLEGTGLRDVTVQTAYKPLTLDYALGSLSHLAPALARVARVVLAPLPRALRARRLLLPLGEMLVTARAAAS